MFLSFNPLQITSILSIHSPVCLKCKYTTYKAKYWNVKRLSAPEGVPRPSPILVLAGPYHTFLRRSDGIRGFHDSMADNEVKCFYLYMLRCTFHINLSWFVRYSTTEKELKGYLNTLTPHHNLFLRGLNTSCTTANVNWANFTVLYVHVHVLK